MTENNHKKNHLNKNKEKENILCVAGAFSTLQCIFYVFHTCNSRMNESAIFKNCENFINLFYMFLCFFTFFSC